MKSQIDSTEINCVEPLFGLLGYAECKTCHTQAHQETHTFEDVIQIREVCVKCRYAGEWKHLCHA